MVRNPENSEYDSWKEILSIFAKFIAIGACAFAINEFFVQREISSSAPKSGPTEIITPVHAYSTPETQGLPLDHIDIIVVKEGDTLTSIAMQLGYKSNKAILGFIEGTCQLNQGLNPDMIYAGQKLFIHSKQPQTPPQK